MYDTGQPAVTSAADSQRSSDEGCVLPARTTLHVLPPGKLSPGEQLVVDPLAPLIIAICEQLLFGVLFSTALVPQV